MIAVVRSCGTYKEMELAVAMYALLKRRALCMTYFWIAGLCIHGAVMIPSMK